MNIVFMRVCELNTIRQFKTVDIDWPLLDFILSTHAQHQICMVHLHEPLSASIITDAQNK